MIRCHKLPPVVPTAVPPISEEYLEPQQRRRADQAGDCQREHEHDQPGQRGERLAEGMTPQQIDQRADGDADAGLLQPHQRGQQHENRTAGDRPRVAFVRPPFQRQQGQQKRDDEWHLGHHHRSVRRKHWIECEQNQDDVREAATETPPAQPAPGQRKSARASTADSTRMGRMACPPIAASGAINAG